jgi:hypothetical protein
MPVRLDIALQRNEDWSRILTISDAAGPVDITGWTFLMQVRPRLSQTLLITAAEIEIIDAPNGKISIFLARLSTGDNLQTVQLPYDLIAIEPDEYQTAFLTGYIILSRGVSHE